MRTAFLLRFEKFCAEHPSPDVRAGTATSTRVQGEQPDSDAGFGRHATFPASEVAGGTMTKTSIERESSGTDSDRTEAQMRAVPRPTTPPVAQTKTLTFVRAEADDTDPRRASLNAIPKCS